MYCQKCGKQLVDEAVVCPACGSPTVNHAGTPKRQHREPSPYRKQVWKLLIAIVFIVNGLARFAVDTPAMMFYMIIGFAFLLWWIGTGIKHKDED